MNKDNFALKMGIDLTRNDGIYDLTFKYRDTEGVQYSTAHQGSNTDEVLDEFQRAVFSHLLGAMLTDNTPKDEDKEVSELDYPFVSALFNTDDDKVTYTESAVSHNTKETNENVVDVSEKDVLVDLHTTVQDLAAQVKMLDKRVADLHSANANKLSVLRNLF